MSLGYDGLAIHVSHFPPGTSKWNKIEHRLFNHISMNWEGQPLVSLEVMIELIGHTTSRTGLQVYAMEDHNVYPTKRKITDEEYGWSEYHSKQGFGQLELYYQSTINVSLIKVISGQILTLPAATVVWCMVLNSKRFFEFFSFVSFFPGKVRVVTTKMATMSGFLVDRAA